MGEFQQGIQAMVGVGAFVALISIVSFIIFMVCTICNAVNIRTVSYTHLTLPTIYSV